jgi:hypothetical protein
MAFASRVTLGDSVGSDANRGMSLFNVNKWSGSHGGRLFARFNALCLCRGKNAADSLGNSRLFRRQILSNALNYQARPWPPLVLSVAIPDKAHHHT